MPKSKVQGHSGSFIFGEYAGKKIVLVSKMHYYESGNIEKVRMPLEIVSKLGVKTVILLSSSGSLNKSFKVGDLMLINDHINMSGINPLIGIEELSFTNMYECYDISYRNLLKQIAINNDIHLQEGVFCQMSGPSYETRAEVEMLRLLGADAVSMSIAHDCIIAKFLGLKVVGVSVIVNVFESVVKELNHKEVLENAKNASKKLKCLLEGFVQKI